MLFDPDDLRIDASVEADRLIKQIGHTVYHVFRKRGGVIGLSGGIDSATILALASKALGSDRILVLIMPDRDSDPSSETLAMNLAAQLGVTVVKEDLTATLTALGCYTRRDNAVRGVFPDYDHERDLFKIVLPQDLLEHGSLNVFSVVLARPGETERRRVLPATNYLEIVAAMNMKQRLRMLTLYYNAECRNYAVIGTSNKNEYGQGFFVKYGDGAADLQPLQHLYKTQVYQLARHLGIPTEIIDRIPSTDTYSAACSQEEFYFRLPFKVLDVIWFAREHQIAAATVADVMGLQEIQVERVYQDIAQKERATQYLRTPPITFLAKD